MYYRVKSGSDNLHAVGTGIGLAVSKQLINMMDGDIDVTSEEGFRRYLYGFYSCAGESHDTQALIKTPKAVEP